MVLIELVLFSSKWEEINKQAVLKPWQTKHGVYLAQSEESHGCMEDWFLNARTTHDVMHHHNQQKLLSPNARHNTLTFFSAGWMSFLSAQILKVLLNALIVMFYLNIKEKLCVSVCFGPTQFAKSGTACVRFVGGNIKASTFVVRVT